MVRVLVCGGRNFSNTKLAYKVLDRMHREYRFDVVIEGNARGADRIAGYWARKNKIDNIKFPADWKLHGRRAGPIRNQLMIDNGSPDLVIAFPGGTGTADMIERAKKACISVYEVPSA